MTERNELKSGIALSYLNLFLGNLVPLFYTPIMLRLLGQAEYGLYSLTASTVSYLAILNFGLGAAVVKYLSKFHASGEKRREERMLGFFLAIFLALALLVLAAGTLLSFNVHLIFSQSLTPAELEKSRILFLLMAVNLAVSFPTSVFSAAIMAHERYIFNRVLALASTLLAPALSLVMLFAGYASVGLVVAGTIVNLAMSIVYVLYCCLALRLTPRLFPLDLSPAREVFAFSVFIFLAGIVNMLYWATDKVILGIYCGTAVVAVYSIAATFNLYLNSFAAAASDMLFPRVNRMVTLDATIEELSAVMIRVGRLQYLVAAFILCGFLLFGREFISMWAGPDYSQAYPLALLVMFPVVIPLIQNTGLRIIEAKSMHQFRAVVYLVIAVLNVIASVILVQRWGAVGCAVATGIAYLLGPGLVMNWFYHKKVGLNIPLFWKHIFVLSRPMLPALLIGVGIDRTIAQHGWGILLVKILLFSLSFFLLLWKYGMNTYEKELLVAPVKKVRHRLVTLANVVRLA
jgi:O-antigen/teichoic acid export membrane protein